MRPNYLNIDKITTDKNVLKIFKIVEKYGGVVRFVGGAVRDTIMGITDFDLDLSTDLTPDELAEACEDAGIKTVPIGLKADALGILVNNTLLTITSLRKKAKDEGKKAQIEFTDNWEEDASRRDLTINAVYADEDGNVFDYYDGISDLENGIVRFIGDPNENVKTDYLRILRFFRFYSIFGKGEPDKKSLKATIDNKDGLKTISIDRIRDELSKILLTPNVVKTLKVMFENNMLVNWLADSDNLDKLEVLNEICIKGNIQPDPLRRLFILYLPDKALAENIAMRLKFTRKLRDTFVKFATTEETFDDFLDPIKRLKMTYKYGKDFCISKFAILAALKGTVSPDTKQVIFDIRNLVVPVLPISGKDIVKMGISEGGEIGKTLDTVELAWVESNFNLSREELLNLIK